MPDHVAIKELFIGGQFIRGAGEVLGVENPATESIFAEVAIATAAQVDCAIDAARAAFDHGPWPYMTIADRVTTLTRMADVLCAHHELLVETAILE
jgi:aldehyde dehydrogenase (NAD+)